MEEDKPFEKVNRVVKVGGTHYLALPTEWLKKQNIKKGDKLKLFGNSVLVIHTGKEKKEDIEDIAEGK
jgi:bifunctional DNA-binding transcriptional regulator/antitoxin component of YhaV-PrlF toxin-antitoxin module